MPSLYGRNGWQEVEKITDAHGPHVGGGRLRLVHTAPSGNSYNFTGIGLRVLAGQRGFGLNAVELMTKESHVLLDCGGGFRGGKVIPDIRGFLDSSIENKAVVLTHTHMDHTGGLHRACKLPGFPKNGLDVYGTDFTLAQLKRELTELQRHHHYHFKKFLPRAPLLIGDLEFLPFTLPHATAQTCGFVISHAKSNTRLLWMTDWRMENNSLIPGENFPAEFIAEQAKIGFNAVFLDSTNMGKPGHTKNVQSDVMPALKDLAAQTKGRLLVGTFARNIPLRIALQQVAKDTGRIYAEAGRSLQNVDYSAQEVGLWPEGIIHIEDRPDIAAQDNLLIAVTGTQCEEGAVLPTLSMRRVYETYNGSKPIKSLALRAEDTLAMCTRVIPGNEEEVEKMIAAIRDNRTRVEDSNTMPSIYSSGHAFDNENSALIRLIEDHCPTSHRPRYLRIHGAPENGQAATELFLQLGISPRRQASLDDGSCLHIAGEHFKVLESMPPSYLKPGIDGHGRLEKLTILTTALGHRVVGRARA